MSVNEQVKTIAKNGTMKKPGNDIKGLIVKMEGEIKKALPKTMTPERFTRITLSALSSQPKLQECTQMSFLAAMMNAAQLGLEPNTPLGQAYLIPYRNKGVMECSFQIGYQGLLDLCYRTGEYKDIYAYEVHENDEFEYELGLEPKLVHKPALTNRGPVIAYYAVYHTKNGGQNMIVASREDIQRHAEQYSKSYHSSSSPWQTSFDAMAKKTVLKQLLKYAPKTTELASAMANDETIKSSIAEDMTLVQDETDYIDIEPATSDVDPDFEAVVKGE